MSGKTSSQNPRHGNSLGFAALSTVMLLCSGCATVLSEKTYPVAIENATGPTFFSVKDKEQQVVHQGITPQQVTLDAKAAPFVPAKYSVVFAGQQSASETHELKAGVDPWIAGNLLLGGVPGTLVDGVTGAMFRLPKSVQGNVPRRFAVTDPSVGASIAQNAIEMNPNASSGVVPLVAPSQQALTAETNVATPASAQLPISKIDSSQVRAASATGGDLSPGNEIVPGSLMRR